MTVTPRSAHLLGCVVAAALATAGCEASHQDTASASPPSGGAAASPAASTAGGAPDRHAPSTAGAPKIDSVGIHPVTSGAAVKGSRHKTTSNRWNDKPGGAVRLPTSEFRRVSGRDGAGAGSA
ncbi:hypothetical protein [Streptomyces sp. NRRL S-31]|uniref:hypothetical protein n=1 Tax=Streptomyces sp. NRRL S-31 TaxID=1463898 RepID=UPI00131DB9C8|nr:hypothetical protein [Streptomyces sp. NRRL S-31]